MMRKNYLIILILGLSALGIAYYTGWINLWEDEETAILDHPVKTNVPFTGFDLTDSSQNNFQIENLQKGKVLLVYLLDGCGACSIEVATISNFQKKQNSDIQIWGVVHDFGDDRNNSHESQNDGIPILVDKGNKLQKQFKMKSFPYNLLLKNGIIIKKWVGIKDEERLKNDLKDS